MVIGKRMAMTNENYYQALRVFSVMHSFLSEDSSSIYAPSLQCEVSRDSGDNNIRFCKWQRGFSFERHVDVSVTVTDRGGSLSVQITTIAFRRLVTKRVATYGRIAKNPR